MAGPYPPVPNVIELLVAGTTPGEKWLNRYFVQYSGAAPSTSNLNSYTNQIIAAWSSNMAPLCTSDVHLAQVQVTDLASNAGASFIQQATTPGTRTGAFLPANAAMLVSYPSAIRYRGGHFRNYLLIGANTDLQDAMNWSTAFQTTAANGHNLFLQSMFLTIGATSFTTHVGVKRVGKFAPNGGPPHNVLTTPVVLTIPPNSGLYHQQIASQKGRIGRRSK